MHLRRGERALERGDAVAERVEEEGVEGGARGRCGGVGREEEVEVEVEGVDRGRGGEAEGAGGVVVEEEAVVGGRGGGEWAGGGGEGEEGVVVGVEVEKAEEVIAAHGGGCGNGERNLGDASEMVVDW